VLCGSEEFHDLEVLAESGGAEIRGMSLDSDQVIIAKL
jgi:hypothetical protein